MAKKSAINGSRQKFFNILRVLFCCSKQKGSCDKKVEVQLHLVDPHII